MVSCSSNPRYVYESKTKAGITTSLDKVTLVLSANFPLMTEANACTFLYSKTHTNSVTEQPNSIQK